MVVGTEVGARFGTCHNDGGERLLAWRWVIGVHLTIGGDWHGSGCRVRGLVCIRDPRAEKTNGTARAAYLRPAVEAVGLSPVLSRPNRISDFGEADRAVPIIVSAQTLRTQNGHFLAL